MANLSQRGGALLLGALLSSACGGGDDPERGEVQSAVPTFTPAEPVITPLPTPVAEAPSEPPAPGPSEAPPMDAPLEPPADAELEGEGEPVDPTICRAPEGVSGRPSNLVEVVALMNALPRPTTLTCFLEALERPLQVFMTSSNQSLQPSPGARSPRTFIVNEPLVMSIVFEGAAAVTLELGYRTTQTRSIKTELIFPLEAEVTYANLFDEIKAGQVTRCSQCHTAEVLEFNDEIQAEVYESDIYEPFDPYDVDVEAVRAERASCDPSVEPERCELLSALFDHGDVVPAPEGIMFDL